MNKIVVLFLASLFVHSFRSFVIFDEFLSLQEKNNNNDVFLPAYNNNNNNSYICFIRFFPLHSQNRRFRIYSIALIISAIFLAMTLAIGFLIPSNHHVLHCRCQTYYVGCLLVGDLLLAINQSYGSLITGLPCLALGKMFRFTICAFINK